MTISEQVKANKRAEKAPQRRAQLALIEHLAIAVLVTGVIAFVAGMHYQNSVSSAKDQAITAAVKTASLKHVQ